MAVFALPNMKLLHVGKTDKEMCKASVSCRLFTKGNVGRRSWVEPLGGLSCPYQNMESL